MSILTGADARLQALGLALPQPTPTHYAYLPALRHGSTVYVAGQIPKLSADQLLVQGAVGEQVGEAAAREAVRLCVLHALSWVAHHAQGSLDAVEQVLRVNYFFQVGERASTRLSAIADTGSELLVAIFGRQGEHPRSVIGVRELPRNAPVLVSMDVALTAADSSRMLAG
ncbi:RidA family protein [Achromobacter sp. ACM03]|uniref:RidA family protein n=1 Tax=Achromobacter sp. ACM03 TaxID=2769300 RepID=UPI001781AC63|nr:RidA family protein [Achromobacter sp. ACM03]MBD9429490.1 RidA family protein [Achromobacter sp. ACM03]